MYRKTLNMMWYLAKAARAVSTATPPGGPSPAMSASDRPLHPHAARASDQHAVAAGDARRAWAAAPSGLREGGRRRDSPPPAPPLAVTADRRANGGEPGDRRARRSTPRPPGAPPRSASPELEHVAEDHPAAPAARRSRSASRAARTRDGIGVAGVVEDPHASGLAPDEPTPDGPPRGRAARRASSSGTPSASPTAAAGGRVPGVVPAGQRQPDLGGRRPGRRPEARDRRRRGRRRRAGRRPDRPGRTS